MPKPKAPKVYARRGPAFFRHTRMSTSTFCVVQVDCPYGDYPHIYCRLAKQCCYVIDTGCGVGDLRAYLHEHCNPQHLPYVIICTHAHFDHISANHQFGPGTEICFSAQAPAFSKAAIGGPMTNFKGEHLANTETFVITRWLQDGELLSLDGAAEPSSHSSLQVLHTPGHTPDGLSLYDPLERRLFSGDALYPARDWNTLRDEYPQYPPGGLFALDLAHNSAAVVIPGSSISVYTATLDKIKTFVMQQQLEGGAEITLACGHNEPCLPAASFVDSCIELFQMIKDGQLKPEEHIMGSLTNAPIWEYVNPRDTRAALVVPQHLVGVA